MRQTVTYRDGRLRRADAAPPFKPVLAAGLSLMMVLVVLSPLMSSPMMSQNGLPFTGDGNPARQALYLFAAALVALGARPVEAPRRLMAVPLPVVVALLVCWVSLSWSIQPDVAVRRLILTTTVTWTIFVATENLGFDSTVKLLRIVLVGVLLVNFITVLGWPSVGVHQFGDADELNLAGDWRGVMMHKNFAGALCAITVLFFLFYSRTVLMPVRIGVIAAAVVFTGFSQSKTSAGMALAAIAIGFLYTRYNARYRVFLVALIVAVSLALPIYMNLYFDRAAYAVNNPYFFTGRGMIWSALAAFFNDHMMLGAGYGSFWNIGGQSPIHQYGTGWVLRVTSGHNGFLDLVVQIGLPGLCIVVLMLMVWPLVRLLRHGELIGQQGALVLTLLIFCIGHNMTESSLLDRDSIPEVFMMFAIALIWRATAKRDRPVAIGGGVFPAAGNRLAGA